MQSKILNDIGGKNLSVKRRVVPGVVLFVFFWIVFIMRTLSFFFSNRILAFAYVSSAIDKLI